MHCPEPCPKALRQSLAPTESKHSPSRGWQRSGTRASGVHLHPGGQVFMGVLLASICTRVNPTRWVCRHRGGRHQQCTPGGHAAPAGQLLLQGPHAPAAGARGPGPGAPGQGPPHLGARPCRQPAPVRWGLAWGRGVWPGSGAVTDALGRWRSLRVAVGVEDDGTLCACRSRMAFLMLVPVPAGNQLLSGRTHLCMQSARPSS